MKVVVSYWQICVYNTHLDIDLDFDLSRSLKVKCDGVIRLPIYGFLLMGNSNIGPNIAP